MTAFKNFLVPTDFGPSSDAALEVAIDLANKYGAKLTLVHTYEIPSFTYEGMAYTTVDVFTPIMNAARAQFDAKVKEVERRVPGATGVLRMGAPWQEILSVLSDTGADLVVMGTHGRKGVAHALIGSVAEKVVRMAKVPVLTVHAPSTPG